MCFFILFSYKSQMYGHYFAKNSQIDDGMMKFYNAVMSESRVEKRQNKRLKRFFLMPYREEKSSYL